MDVSTYERYDSKLMAIIKPPFVIPEVEGWQGWVVLGLIGLMLIALVAELAPPYLVMMGTLIILLALSIIDVEAAFHGFSDPAVLCVAVLFVVAKGLEMSGGLEYAASILFKVPNKTKTRRPGYNPSRVEGSIVWVLLKFCVPVAMFSAFLANIPLVAMMIPPIVEFSKKMKLPPSKMLMPLSYAAQLGGTMTLIGATTNLVVLSMAAQKLPNLHMNLFEIGIVGLPITIAGVFYIVAFSGKLLPERTLNQATTTQAREYNAVLAIKQTSRIARKSIEMSGLGNLPGLDLVAITREIDTIPNPTPDFVLQPKDQLHFVGVIDSLLLLVPLKGFTLTEDEGQGEVDLNRLKPTQILVEAVIAQGSSMVQERIADLQCRTRFNSVIVAIHRHGKRLTSLVGDIRVEAGDCLLMVADTPDFVTKHRNNSHFALVSQLPGFKPINRKKALFASILVVSMVVASGVGVDLIKAALYSSAGLLLTKCLTPHDAVESIELPVLIMIAAAFGIAEGMVQSGAATILAKALMGLAGKSLFGLISCTYVATTLFSLTITNSAAVTIMFPVALAAANHQALDFRPFAYILMMAASAGFMTPTACPTNLMVYTPGSYKFSDYINYGGPLQLWLLFVTVGVTMSPKYWYVWVIVILAITCGATPLIARHKSTHPKPIAVAPSETKSLDGEHDDENPRDGVNVGTFMLAPGHDNEETTNRRTSQLTFPASSSSTPSFPTTFPSPFPPPYRMDDSLLPSAGYSSSISSSSTSTRTSQNSRDSDLSSPFPPPYRLDDSAVPTGGFSSIRTSLSSKGSQFLFYGTTLSPYNFIDPSSNQTGLSADPPLVLSPPSQPSPNPLPIPEIKSPSQGQTSLAADSRLGLPIVLPPPQSYPNPLPIPKIKFPGPGPTSLASNQAALLSPPPPFPNPLPIPKIKFPGSDSDSAIHLTPLQSPPSSLPVLIPQIISDSNDPIEITVTAHSTVELSPPQPSLHPSSIPNILSLDPIQTSAVADSVKELAPPQPSPDPWAVLIPTIISDSPDPIQTSVAEHAPVELVPSQPSPNPWPVLIPGIIPDSPDPIQTSVPDSPDPIQTSVAEQAPVELPPSQASLNPISIPKILSPNPVQTSVAPDPAVQLPSPPQLPSTPTPISTDPGQPGVAADPELVVLPPIQSTPDPVPISMSKSLDDPGQTSGLAPDSELASPQSQPPSINPEPILKIKSFSWDPSIDAQEANPKPIPAPFRTRRPWQQTFFPSLRLPSQPVLFSPSLRPPSQSLPQDPQASDLEALKDNDQASSSVMNVRISGSPKEDAAGVGSSAAAAPSSSSTEGARGLLLASPSRSPASRDSSLVPTAGREQRPSKAKFKMPSYMAATRSPDRSRKTSRALSRSAAAARRKSSKSPRSGSTSARGSPRNKPGSRSAPGPPQTVSNVVEEDLTGGISKLLSTRRLSSLKDSSSFADNNG